MREIKFRAWDTRSGHGKMVLMTPEITPFTHHDLVEEDDWRVMQFTGLRDKNGKEIYEGDILQAGPSGRLYPISWCGFGAGFWAANGQLYHDPRRWPESEVIGNIYEHGHLLESK